MSYRIIFIEPCGSPCGNGLRYPSEEDAEAGYRDLARRWTGCPSRYSIDPSDDPVNVRYPVKPEGIK
jgi:hypothetical protein